MAQNMTPEEIQAEFAAYAEALKNGTANTKEWADRMKDAEAGVKGYTAQLSASLAGLKSSALSTMGALKDGQQGASVFNSSLEKGADAVSDFASKFGLIGAIIGAVVKAATAYITAVNKQSDALYKSYQDISKVGATGKEGMQGVFDSMQKFGYGIEDLGKMADLIKQNSATLAQFGGTAIQGTKQLANLAGEIQHSPLGREFQLMGMSVDDINKQTANYLKNQVVIGKNSQSMQQDLAANTAAYIKELNILSKITGQSAEQQQAALDAANAEEAYNQTLYELDQRAKSGDAQAAAQAKKIRDLQLSNLPDDIKKELTKSIGGDVSAAQHLMMVAPTLYKNAMDSSKTYDETIDSATKDFKNATDALGGTAKLGMFGSVGGSLADIRKFQAQQEGTTSAEQKKAAKDATVVTDAATQAATDTRISQMNTRDAMQSMLQEGIVPVTKGMKGLSGAIESVTRGTSKAVGAAPAGGAPPIGGGGGAPAGAPPAPKSAMPAGGETAGAKPGGKAGAQANAAEQLKDLLPGGSQRTRAAQASVAKPPATAGSPTTPPTSGGADPSKAVAGKDISGINQSLAGAIKSAATEFMAVSGKPITVTSAVRSPEEQQKLYDDFQAGKAKYPVAPPGKSKHDRGEAVDIDSSTANALDQMGLLAKYGLSRPVPKDPVHIELAKGFADGGVATGPTSGYKATMQGTNAVVPLPSGKEIPVDMPEFNTNLADQTAILNQQLLKLDDLLRAMQNQVGVSQKILQHSA